MHSNGRLDSLLRSILKRNHRVHVYRFSVAVDGIDDLMSDHFADAEYRSHLAKVMVKRALEA